MKYILEYISVHVYNQKLIILVSTKKLVGSNCLNHLRRLEHKHRHKSGVSEEPLLTRELLHASLPGSYTRAWESTFPSDE
jgi:hypothetical protein